MEGARDGGWGGWDGGWRGEALCGGDGVEGDMCGRREVIVVQLQ